MSWILSDFLIIKSVAGVSLTTAYVSGIFHSSAGALVKLTVKRSCVSETLLPWSRFTLTMGNPGCSVQPAAICATGLPEGFESAFHKSAVVVFEYICAAM